jgi:hypothetical protein
VQAVRRSNSVGCNLLRALLPALIPREMAAAPQALKEMSQFLTQATQIDTFSPLFAYYCLILIPNSSQSHLLSAP